MYGRELGRSETRRLVDEAFASYARYWVESLRLPSLTPEQIDAGITYTGKERLYRSLEAGKGTILALPHLGGWEWAGCNLAQSGIPMSVVVEALRPPEVFEWFVGFRERLGMHVIPLGPGVAAECSRALTSNRVLCLLCDRVVGDSPGIEVEFFGERTRLPAGPMTLAMRSGATVLPAAVYFTPEAGRHIGVFGEPVPVLRAGRFRDDLRAGTQSVATSLEGLIRQAPTQWHLMQPNWPSDTIDGDSSRS